MMGGGVCWVDIDNDGWLDLFAVNSYADADLGYWQQHGGMPRSALFHNVRRDVHGRQPHVGRRRAAPRQRLRRRRPQRRRLQRPLRHRRRERRPALERRQGPLHAKAPGRPGSRRGAGTAGATIGDVNGDGRPDLFVAGYADVNAPVPAPTSGLPEQLPGRARPALPQHGERRERPRHASARSGEKLRIDAGRPEHGLGAVFTDVNGDGRARPLRRERREPEPALPERAVARRREGRPARASASGSRSARRRRASPTRTPAWASPPPTTAATAAPTSSSPTRTSSCTRVFRSDPPVGGTPLVHRRPVPTSRRHSTRASPAGAPRGSTSTTTRNLDLVLANGAIPVTGLGEERGARPGVREPDRPRSSGRVRSRERRRSGWTRLPAVNGRGPRGGRLRQRRQRRRRRQLDRRQADAAPQHGREGQLARGEARPRFAPGAVVTAVLPDGRRLVQELHAGSSYLSSEDPRAHFGLGQGEDRAGADRPLPGRPRDAPERAWRRTRC